VAVANSGAKALAALEDEKPDIVLTDIRMPGAGGLDVLSASRAVDPEMPVILDDGAGLAPDRRAGGERGRLLLPAEAVRQRGAAGDLQARGRGARA
jgi:CheY-like chemotaxis protein